LLVVPLALLARVSCIVGAMLTNGGKPVRSLEAFPVIRWEGV
jgi:hypothetical protein